MIYIHDNWYGDDDRMTEERYSLFKKDYAEDIAAGRYTVYSDRYTDEWGDDE